MDSDSMRKGIIPGIMSGYVFMAFMGPGMADMVGGMISGDGLIGFILHIIISAVIGALYTGVFVQYVKMNNPLLDIAVGGLIYGGIWGIVGGLIIMPAIAGGELLQISLTDPSLFGHIIYGHVLAFLVVLRNAAFGMDS
ncbi:MAG: hypothetical protein F4Z94_00525 [Chloroflexi bacterium]|nr:hypothetical protein [Chloroflexota bacterium]